MLPQEEVPEIQKEEDLQKQLEAKFDEIFGTNTEDNK